MFYLDSYIVISFNYQLQVMTNITCIPQVTDKSLLLSILHSIKHSVIFNVDQFPTLADKAGHLWYMLARYQVFNNGNKRTAIISTLAFLMVNRYKVDFTNKDITENLYKLTKLVGQDKCSEKDLVKFLNDNMKSSKENIMPEDMVSYFLKQKNLKDILFKLAEE